MKSKKLKKTVAFGIIGCGNAAQAHADAIAKNPESLLKAVFDINSRKAEEFAAKYGCTTKNNLPALLNDKEIEALIICTPHDTHTNLITKTLASKKFCITEKPLYLTASDRERIKGFAGSKKVIVVFQVRFHEPIRFLLESVKSGRLGKIRFCNVTVRKNRNKGYFSDWHGIKKRAGGMLLNQGMHALDLMLEICGTPLKTSGVIKNIRKLSEIEDFCISNVQFLNGAVGGIEITTCIRDAKPENSILVIGSKGSIKIGGGVFDRVEYAHFDDKKTSLFPKEKDGNGHPKFIAAVNDFILRGRKNSFLPFAADGLRANRFAELLYRTTQRI